MNLTNKKILITGGNDGIGFATAKIISEKGGTVTILGRNEQKLKDAVSNLGAEADYIVCDLGDYMNIMGIENNLQERDFDVVINNAGLIEYNLIEDHDSKSVHDMVSVNLEAPLQVCRILVSNLKKKKEAAIVNISSVSGLKGRANETVYDATKWGIHGFTLALQDELAETNVKVIGIYPGGVDTELFDKSGGKKPSGNLMNPKEIAEAIVFALERPLEVKMDQVVINRNKGLGSKV